MYLAGDQLTPSGYDEEESLGAQQLPTQMAKRSEHSIWRIQQSLDHLLCLYALSTDAAPFVLIYFANFTSCDACICLKKFIRSLQLYCKSVLMDKNAGAGFEEAVNIL